MKMFTHSFLKLLDVNITPEDQQIEQGGLQDAPGDFGVA